PRGRASPRKRSANSRAEPSSASWSNVRTFSRRDTNPGLPRGPEPSALGVRVDDRRSDAAQVRVAVVGVEADHGDRDGIAEAVDHVNTVGGEHAGDLVVPIADRD